MADDQLVGNFYARRAKVLLESSFAWSADQAAFLKLDAMMASARAGKRALINFQEAGFEALAKLTRPQKRVWPRLLRKRTRSS